MGLDEKRIEALTMQVSDCLRKENEAPDHRVMVMALEGWAVLQKESLGKFIAMAATANKDYTQRFARVAIVPKPNSRRSAVTSVRPSTPAVATKKRSAGSAC